MNSAVKKGAGGNSTRQKFHNKLDHGENEGGDRCLVLSMMSLNV